MTFNTQYDAALLCVLISQRSTNIMSDIPKPSVYVNRAWKISYWETVQMKHEVAVTNVVSFEMTEIKQDTACCKAIQSPR